MKIRSWAEIYQKKLIKNAKKVFEFSGKNLIAVVKADAYGHNSIIISKILEKLDFVEFLAVATAEEGKQLRQEGISKKILVLGGLLEDEIDCFNKYNLIPVVSDFNSLSLVPDLYNKKIHLKFDTGMGRLGFYKEDIEKLISFVKENNIHIYGVMTHFPSADIDKDFTKEQIQQFKQIVEILEKNGFYMEYIHCQNSAGIVYDCGFCNLVRVGLLLYGEKPTENFPIDVENIMYVKSRLISKKRVKKGSKISYTGSFIAPTDMDIGIVSFGYADGIPRNLSNKGYVLVNCKKAKIIGNITMDMTIIDLTNIEADVGDEVVIIGKQDDYEINFTHIARQSNTIPYEIMCGISKRVKRVFIED